MGKRVYFGIFFLLVIALGCGLLDKEDEDTDIATVTFEFEFGKVQSNRSMTLLTVSQENIQTITINVIKISDDSAVDTLVLVNDGSGKFGDAKIFGIGLNTKYRFEVDALDASENVLFTGSAEQEFLNAGEYTVKIIMQQPGTDSSIELTINPVSIDSAIEVGTFLEIEFTFSCSECSTGQQMEYEVSAENGTINSQFTGTHNFGGSLVIEYTALNSAGDDTITMTVWLAGSEDSTSTQVPLSIVQTTSGNSDIELEFGPSILRVNFLRTINSLAVTLKVDPTNDIIFNWFGTGSFETITSGSNPLYIHPFDDSYSGHVSCTVTDQNGLEASIKRTIDSGDFPYPVKYNEPKPVDTVLKWGSSVWNQKKWTSK